MSRELCNIILNSDSTGCFYAGDTLTGSVIVEFNQKQKVEHFNLEVTGISKASWTRPMPTIPYVKIYSETRIVLKVHTDIFSELQGKTVLPGIYTHPFYFSLPPDLPTTFKSSIAKVFYYIKASYNFKEKASVSFYVSRNLDLNHLEEFLTPTFTEMHKTFWNSGKLLMQLQLFTGFAPHQIISFEAMIINEDRVKLSKLSITLVQEIQYNVSSGYLNKAKNLENICFSKFQNTSKEICNLNMKIPQTTPTCNHDNNMIKIEYKLLVELVFSYHFTLSKKLPVTVSTVPVTHVK